MVRILQCDAVCPMCPLPSKQYDNEQFPGTVFFSEKDDCLNYQNDMVKVTAIPFESHFLFNQKKILS